jgi:hypothetical protein
MRLLELIEGADGKLDEQSALSIAGVVTFLGLEIYDVAVLHHVFDPQTFGFGFGAVMAATLGGMAYRESKGVRNAAVPDQLAR